MKETIPAEQTELNQPIEVVDIHWQDGTNVRKVSSIAVRVVLSAKELVSLAN